jgi:hypothetical protein
MRTRTLSRLTTQYAVLALDELDYMFVRCKHAYSMHMYSRYYTHITTATS